MGRPTRLNDIIAQRIVNAVETGVSRTAQAAMGGVHRATLMDWLARGREGEAPYADFLDRVKEAEAKAEAQMVECVRIAGLDPKHWTAAAWWLERTRPNDYAKREPLPEAETERAESGVTDDLALAESVVEAIKSRRAV